MLDSFGSHLPAALSYKTQAATDEKGIPDLVGCDSEGIEHAIIEAKFWAGLTPRQPLAYVDRLPTTSGLLLFLIPGRRADTLWPHLVQRCHLEGRELSNSTQLSAESRVASFQDGRRLGLISWRAALDVLHIGLVQAGDVSAAADLVQLRGLTDRMDSDLYVPFTGEELTSSLGTRVLQLCQLVDQTVERMVGTREADIQNLRATGSGHAVYSRYFRMCNVGCRVYFTPEGWSKYSHPIGLEIKDGQGVRWKGSPEINAKLAPLAHRFPQRFSCNEYGAWLALEIPVGVEMNEVIDDLICQIRDVAVLLKAERTPSTNGS